MAAIAIPRIGMEVLVTFLEGDPDQPLVTGCLYHAEHVVPYDLPANKTRSLFKTLSSPGGGGYNELRIEDKKGAEQIYLHAQRDWDENIEHDQKIRVGNERHDTVEANSYSEFKAEEHRTTHADRKVEIKANDHLTVGQNQHIKIGTGQLIKPANEIHYTAGRKWYRSRQRTHSKPAAALSNSTPAVSPWSARSSKSTPVAAQAVARGQRLFCLGLLSRRMRIKRGSC